MKPSATLVDTENTWSLERYMVVVDDTLKRCDPTDCWMKLPAENVTPDSKNPLDDGRLGADADVVLIHP